MTDDPVADALVDLAAENVRLRAALAEAGIDAAGRPDERPEQQVATEADLRSQLAISRAETAESRRQARRVRSDAESELAASQDLVADLRASRAALAASEERLSFAFAASGSLGWWDWDIPNDRLHAGEHLARMFGMDPAAAAAGRPMTAYLDGVHPDDRRWLGERIRRATAEGGDFTEDYRVVGRDGSVTWIHARGRCYHDAAGRPVRFPGVALDITRRKSADLRKDALVDLGEALRDLEEIGHIAYRAAEIMARALGAARAGYGTVDPTRETVLLHPDWGLPGTASVAGLHQFGNYGSFIDDLKRGEPVIIGDTAADARARTSVLLGLGIRGLINVPILVRRRLTAVAFVHYDRPHACTPDEIAFVRTVADRAQAAVARVQAVEQQAVLNHELSHRLKNTLALVQSIAGQTLRNAPDMETARDALSLRLIALGKAHDILIAAGQESADVGEVVRGALDLHVDAPDRFNLDGPAVRVGPSAALSLALVLHELATNAAKYGALSTAAGRVAVGWTVQGSGEAAAFRLHWSEAGGPPVAPPARKGFGTRLIERGLSGGKVSTEYRPEGLACTLVAPLAAFSAGVPDGEV